LRSFRWLVGDLPLIDIPRHTALKSNGLAEGAFYIVLGQRCLGAVVEGLIGDELRDAPVDRDDCLAALTLVERGENNVVQAVDLRIDEASPIRAHPVQLGRGKLGGDYRELLLANGTLLTAEIEVKRPPVGHGVE